MQSIRKDWVNYSKAVRPKLTFSGLNQDISVVLRTRHYSRVLTRHKEGGLGCNFISAGNDEDGTWEPTLVGSLMRPISMRNKPCKKHMGMWWGL